MEIATNNACSEHQPVAPKRGKQFLLDFMAEEQLKKSKSGGANAANSQLIREEYASVKRVSLVYEKSLSSRPCITDTQAAISVFSKYWKLVPASDQERFVIACLDTKNRVQSIVGITVGTLDASLVHPREVFKPAVLEGSASIMLSHNHPSGNPTPSPQDIAVTDRLTEVGKLIGINVLDHIIYGDAISFREYK